MENWSERCREMSTRAVAIWVAAAASVLALLPAPACPQERAFDLDTGNAPHEVVIPAALPPSYSRPATPPVLHMTVQLNNAWFDAIAPTTRPLSASPRGWRRPASERATNRQQHRYPPRELPGAHRAARSSGAVAGDAQRSGLGSDDPTATRRAGGHRHPGWRRYSPAGCTTDEPARRRERQYYRQPYADYLGYRPVNTADPLRDRGAGSRTW
jgi:hypothetical protein